MTGLEFDGISIDLGSALIVEGVSLRVEPGEIVGLIGPNGSGKSTLLRSAYRVLRPVGGAALVGGEDVWKMSAREAARRRAIVTQHTVLDAEFSVAEVVAMGRNPRKRMLERDGDQDHRIIQRALEDVHMGWAAQRSFATLSGGEQQRVLLARALAQETGLLILDEPTNHLDVRAQFEILDLLRHLRMTTLTALHDLDHAVSYCDRVAVMAGGRLVAQGAPADVLTPGLVHEVFGVRAVLDTHPITGRPRIAVASDPTPRKDPDMQVAIVLHPGFTALDVLGPYEVLGRLPDAEVVFVAEQPGLVRNDLGGLAVDAVLTLDDVPAPDVVVIGGGAGQEALMVEGSRMLDWLRAVDRTSTWTTAVCTGTFFLAAAGLLKDRRATTHWAGLGMLTDFGVTPARERVVIDGHYATAAGVSAGIDMALTLAGLISGDETAQTVQLYLEYAPEPPYAAGSPDTAPAAVVDKVTRMLSA